MSSNKLSFSQRLIENWRRFQRRVRLKLVVTSMEAAMKQLVRLLLRELVRQLVEKLFDHLELIEAIFEMIR